MEALFDVPNPGYFTKPLAIAHEHIKALFDSYKIDKTHGLEHAMAVMTHTVRALQWHKGRLRSIPSIRILEILLAALLHDADDRKYFSTSKDHKNASFIATEALGTVLTDRFLDESVRRVVNMVDYVSFHEWGNNVPDEAKDSPEVLYPRFADRFEAFGYDGLLRCIEYCVSRDIPYDKPDTLRVTNAVAAYGVSINRHLKKDKSDSFIDHIYDKLLAAAEFETNNGYFDELRISRKDETYNVIINYGHGVNIYKMLGFKR